MLLARSLRGLCWLCFGLSCESAEWKGWEEKHEFVEILEDDLSEATTTQEKDELTGGMFSRLNESAALRKDVEQYAVSAHGKKEVICDDSDEENPSPRTSGFPALWTFPKLYEWACSTIYFERKPWNQIHDLVCSGSTAAC